MFFPKHKPLIFFSFFFVLLLVGSFFPATETLACPCTCVGPSKIFECDPSPCSTTACNSICTHRHTTGTLMSDSCMCSNPSSSPFEQPDLSSCQTTCGLSHSGTPTCPGGEAPPPGAGTPPTPTPTPTPSSGGGTTSTPPSTPRPERAAPSAQCNTVNPECLTAWESGERSRFISSADCYCCGNCGLNDIVNIFINAADYLFGVLGALALLFFIYGGLVWLTSGGSAGQIDKGKKILIGAVIGMALALGAWLIIKFLITALGVTQGTVTGF